MTDTTDTTWNLRIGSLNVQGGRADGFFKGVADWGAQVGFYDIIACQETKLHADKNTKYLLFDRDEPSAYQGHWASASTGALGSGVALLVNETWNRHIIRKKTHNGRGISLDFGFHQGAHIRIINCYVPANRGNVEGKKEFKELLEWVLEEMQDADKRGMETVVCGDFNGVVNPALDRSNESKQNTNTENELLGQLVGFNQFTDSFRKLYPEARAYSHNETSRLDMIWLSQGLTGVLTGAGMMSLEGIIRTDHKIVFADLCVRTLVSPTPIHILEQYYATEYKIKVDDASDEQWELFSVRLDEVLEAKMTSGSAGNYYRDTDTSTPTETPILEEDMIDTAWDNLATAIMDVALKVLPRKRVGPQSLAYRANAQNYHQGRSLGELLRLSYFWFVDPNCPTQGKERRQMAAHETICKVWVRVHQDNPTTAITTPPVLEADRTEWEQWRDTVQTEWHEQQRAKREVKKKQKDKEIAEAVEKRDLRFSTNTKSTIQSILEINRSSATLDRVQITVDDRIAITDHPSHILDHVKTYFEAWHGPRQSEDIPEGSLWEEIYRPADDVDAEWYAHLLDIPSNVEIERAVKSAPSNKAAGASKVTKELLEHMGKKAMRLFCEIVKASVLYRRVPLQWTEGVIFCLSKTNPWTGSLADVRPITLLEHGRKILFSILTNRLSSIMLEHNILKGANFSVLKGTSTADPIHIVNAVMEDAIQHKRELWILLQDMKRCYDSVNCKPGGMLSLALDRLKIPKGFQDMLFFITNNKTNRVITSYGLTDKYSPACGLDQGGVECPLLWRIAYDALLVAIDKQQLGYIMTTPPGLGKEPPMVSNAAYVDDTKLIAPSRPNLERITTISSEFFRIHGIEINGKKTELLAINPTDDGTITYGGSEIRPQDKSKASRILGVWFSADGKATTTKELAMKETNTICEILGRKMITDKQCIFIINAVLIPRLLYRMSATLIGWQDIERITAQYRKVVRKKLGLPSSTPCSILHHTRLYGLRDLKDALAEQHISTLHLRSINKGIVGDLTHCRLQDLQEAAHMAESPLANPAIARRYNKHNIIAQVCQLMVERDITMRDVGAAEDNRVLLSRALTEEVFARNGLQLKKDGIRYLEDIVSEDHTHTRTWQEVATAHNIQGATPKQWYTEVCQAISEHPAMDVEEVLFEYGDEDDNRLLEEALTRRHQENENENENEKEKEKEKEGSDQEGTRGMGRAVAISDDSHGPEENRCLSQEKEKRTERQKEKEKQTEKETDLQEGDLFLGSYPPFSSTSSSPFDSPFLVSQTPIVSAPVPFSPMQSPIVTSFTSPLFIISSSPPSSPATTQSTPITIPPQPTTPTQVRTISTTPEVSPFKQWERPATPPRTGNKVIDKYHKKLHKQVLNRVIDTFTAYRRDRDARVKQQKLVQKLKENAQKARARQQKVQRKLEQKLKDEAQRKARVERQRKAKEAAETALTHKQRYKRQVKARRKELAEEAYQLIPAITALVQQQATNNNTLIHKYNYVIMDPTAQEAIESSRTEATLGVRHIYSDGSMVDKGTRKCSMAFAVVGEEQATVQGTTKGFASSAKAELMGLIAGIIATPKEQDLCIRLDNQAVVKQFKEVVTNRKQASVRAKLRCDYAAEWAVAARICSERTGSTTVEWVKGHDGNEWNGKADLAAKEAQSQAGTAWQVDRAAQDDIKYSVTMAGVTLDQDTRHVLKMQTTRRWHQDWRALKRTKRSIQDYKGTDWLATLSIIHNNKPVNTFFSSQQDTRLRSHRIKKVHGMLPTMDALHTRRPDLYKDDRCRQCDLETEDNDHIWVCPESRETQKELWKDALDRVDGWGETATRHYNKQRQKKLQLGKQPPKDIAWTMPRTSACRKALWQVVERPGEEQDHQQHCTKAWTVCHLFRGLVPTALTKEWGKVFKEIPEKITQHVSRLFCRYIEKEARERLWKPRCERTAEWERENNITQSMKVAKIAQNERTAWKQIYGRKLQEGECLCGRAVAEHEGQRCPGEQRDTRMANQAVIDSLLGLRRMDIMERRGKMTINELEADDT